MLRRRRLGSTGTVNGCVDNAMRKQTRSILSNERHGSVALAFLMSHNIGPLTARTKSFLYNIKRHQVCAIIILARSYRATKQTHFKQNVKTRNHA